MDSDREYPLRPVVGVGGVVILHGRALLVRRATEPMKGQWSIPGGTLELGETLEQGVQREPREETGMEVRVVGLIDVFERIENAERRGSRTQPPRFHYVVLDYLCEALGGRPGPGSDTVEIAWVNEEELSAYCLSDAATRILRKAFEMNRKLMADG
ncbi:MAG: NUDIX hydrolase [Acidobacteriota bacterium]